MDRLRVVAGWGLCAAAGVALSTLAACGSSAASSGPSPDASTRDGAHDAQDAHDAPAESSVDASAWNIAPGCNPLAVTGECMLPYPSDLLTVADSTSATGLRVALPTNALSSVPAGATAIDMAPLNRFDGAPTSAPILVHFGVDVAKAFLSDDTQTAASVSATSPIALFDEATGDRVPFLSEMDENAPTAPTRHALILRPLTPLKFGSKYVVAIQSTLRDVNGAPLPSSHGFVALRDTIATTNAALEGSRAHFESLFAFLAAHGYARSSLALAWDYTTASSAMVTGPIATMRQQVFHASTGPGAPVVDGGVVDGAVDASSDAPAPAQDGGDAGAGSTITYTIDSVTPSPFVQGAQVIEGSFTPPNYLRADNTIEYSPSGEPALQPSAPQPSYPFTMIVPPAAATQTLGLVVFGHGLFGAGRDYLTTSYGSTIQPLTQQLGAVVIATDWIGLSKGDLPLVENDVVTNLNHFGIVTDRLLQAIVNNLSLVELSLGALQADPRVRMSTSQPLLDPTRVGYYGVSLGGIEGSSFASVSRNITHAVVAVPGASWSNLLARSDDYAPFQAVINATYPDPLFQQEFIDLMQARFDPADPINLATLFSKNPLPDSPSARTVILQESIDDCQVPNLTTELLARAYGVSQLSPFIQGVYGLEAVTSPTTANVLSQFELSADVAKYVPPTSNVLPTMDNGAHFDLAFRPQALAEVVSLLGGGQVVQSCGDAGASPCVLP